MTYIGVDIMGDRNRFVREQQVAACSNKEGSAVCNCGEDPEFQNTYGSDTCASCPPCTAPLASEEAETRADACRCGIRCAPAGSDTAHGSHGFNCNRNYQKWDTARRLKW